MPNSAFFYIRSALFLPSHKLHGIPRIRPLFAIFVVALFAMPTTSMAKCSPLPASDVVWKEGLLTIAPQFRGEPAKLQLSGVLSAKSAGFKADIADLTPHGLCTAAVSDLTLNSKTPLCSAFRDSFGKDDSLIAGPSSLSFSTSATLNDAMLPTINLSPPGVAMPNGGWMVVASKCSTAVTIRVVAHQGSNFELISPLPDRLDKRTVEFGPFEADGSQLLSIIVATDERDFEKRPQVGPPSLFAGDNWAASAAGELLRTVIVAVLLLFIFKLGSVRIYAARPAAPLLDRFLPAIRATATLLTSASMLEITRWWVSKTNGPPFDRQFTHIQTQFVAPLHLVATEQETQLTGMLIGGALLLVAGIALGLISVALVLASKVLPKIRTVPVADCFGVLAMAAFLAMTATAFSAGVLVAENDMTVFFQIPAALISVGVALFALFALRKVFRFHLLGAAGLALFASLTFLAPAAAVIRSSYLPTAAENTIVWFSVASFSVAGMMYTVTLLAIAFSLSRPRRAESRILAADRALFAILALCVTVFGFGNLLNAAATLAVWFAADQFIFRRQSGGFAPPGTANLGHLAKAQTREELRWKAVLGGLLTMMIFWLQFSLHKSGDFDLSVLAGTRVLLDSFAVGAIGTLFLGQAFDRIPGSSAAAKALLLAAIVIALNIASELDNVLISHAVLPPITEYVGFVAAILAVAVLVYDIPDARAKAGDLPLSELFKGTTLAQTVPIVTGLGAALLSALSPILVGAVGTAFRTMIEQLSHSGAQLH